MDVPRKIQTEGGNPGSSHSLDSLSFKGYTKDPQRGKNVVPKLPLAFVKRRKDTSGNPGSIV